MLRAFTLRPRPLELQFPATDLGLEVLTEVMIGSGFVTESRHSIASMAFEIVAEVGQLDADRTPQIHASQATALRSTRASFKV